MAADVEQLRAILADPRESLGVELKRWIEPAAPESVAKIARGCLALRNNNGGVFVVGFTDEGKPDGENIPADVRAAFNPNAVQAIVSKYASDPFPVEVHFVERDGQVYPVIEVPPGVTTLVCAKSDLRLGDKVLVKDHAVYARTLNSNNTVSSAEPRRGDWERLLRTCFENREADIGAFVRRHLSSLDLPQLAALLGGAAPPPAPTALERATSLLARGRARFDTVVSERGVRLPRVGLREAAIVIDGEVPAHTPTAPFLQRLTAMKPRHSGWSPWVTGVNSGGEGGSEYVFEGGWESLIAVPDHPLMPGVDFWRIDPRGEFYHLEGLPDDFYGQRGLSPGRQLDFTSQISRVVEFIVSARSFAQSMGCAEGETSLACVFRWSGLRGRRLVSRRDPHSLYPRPPATQDEVQASVVVPLHVPASALAPFVHRVVRELFLVFGGAVYEDRVIEQWVQETLRNRY